MATTCIGAGCQDARSTGRTPASRQLDGPARPSTTSNAPSEIDQVTIRFAGDSGDGMQLAGARFTLQTALQGNDFVTRPDFPAEIRAPAGSVAGVSAFEISFASDAIHADGDALDVLVAMNPAALRAHLPDARPGATIIVDTDAFSGQNVARAGFETSPLDDGTLDRFSVITVPIAELATEAVSDLGLSRRHVGLTRNLFALGLVSWLTERDVEPTVGWVRERFADRPDMAEADLRALRAGWAYGETAELAPLRARVRPATLPPGTYRDVSGNEATALGFVAAAELAGRDLFYASYPITPASDILHRLSTFKHHGVRTFQAEDEIAAIGAAIGASYGGALGMTASSGPGIALKSEAMGLAVMVELPLVIVDVQRAGPSTGMPTKTEQSDLLQVLFGRNGDAPMPVVAPATPAECFATAIEAWRLALTYMTPVVFLSDASLATSSEPWRLPDPDDLPDIRVPNHVQADGFAPYARDPRTLARPWAVPGTPGLEHRIGGLESADISGSVSYDPDNHQRMTLLRAAKIAGIATDVPPLAVEGPDEGDLLLLGWGSTYGTLRTAAERLRADGLAVGHAHLRHLNPFPPNTGDVLGSFRHVLVPEVNAGQLRLLIRGRYLVDAVGLNRVRGKPLAVTEVAAAARLLLDERKG